MLSIPAPRIILRTIAERRPLMMSVAVLGWSTKYLVDLALTHTTGAEAYGVLVAALGVGAGVANLGLLRSRRLQASPRVSVVLTLAVMAVWSLVALGGISGTIAHLVGPVAGHGPIDLRPRPIPAPLVFTVLGIVGGIALFTGQRAATRRAMNHEEE
jgi:hypothetical protein